MIWVPSCSFRAGRCAAARIWTALTIFLPILRHEVSPERSSATGALGSSRSREPCGDGLDKAGQTRT